MQAGRHLFDVLPDVLTHSHALGFIEFALLIEAPLDQLHGNSSVVGGRPGQQMIQALLFEILQQGIAQLPRRSDLALFEFAVERGGTLNHPAAISQFLIGDRWL